ncbi:MAG: iron ABC transporter permease [Planctomycetota bacterium]
MAIGRNESNHDAVRTRFTLPRPTEEHGWIASALLVTLLVVVPVTALVIVSTADSSGAWRHLVDTKLLEYVRNTTVLILSVCIVATLIGVAAGWLITAYEFPARAVLDRAMILPLAVPPYLSAYAYSDALQAGGPIESWFRGTLGWSDAGAWPIDIRSLPAAAIILALALFPYVYIAARQAFESQGYYATVVARTLGMGPIRSFARVAIPLAWPAVIVGAGLVLMETVADFGVADYCAVDTLSTGVYRAWFGMDAPSAAARLSIVTLGGVVALLLALWCVRRAIPVHHAASTRPSQRVVLSRASSICVLSVCAIPVVLGAVVPTVVFVVNAVGVQPGTRMESFLGNALDTGVLATIAGLVAVALGLVVTYAKRLTRSRLLHALISLSTLGYAVPGTVIAVGLLIPLSWLDHTMNSIGTRWGGDRETLGLLLTGSLVAVVLGCQTRFLAVSAGVIESSLGRVRASIDEAARTLGVGATSSFFRVHLPICTGGALAAGLLVFVDVAKELPMTLMLRPFNFDTLAVRTHQLASDERLGEASLNALGIIGVGVVAILILSVIGTAQPRSVNGTRTDGLNHD